jgi:predicted nuclease of predicted toxin-antitoxin system
MLLLANENIPLASVKALRDAGHDVLSITEHQHGIADAEVMAIAHAQQRCIITFDRDYGELIFVNRLPTPPAVFYLRVAPSNPQSAALAVLALLQELGNQSIEGFFVVDAQSYRRRPMPVF